MLCGVLLQFTEGEVVMVATDGHRLACSRFKGSYKFQEGSAPDSTTAGTGRDMIIPPKALQQVVRLAAGTVNVGLTVSKNYATFDLGNTTVYSRLIDGNFPNYEMVIPKTNPKEISIGREDLIAAVRRVSVLADSVTHQIKVSVRPERIELSVNTADVGEGSEQVPVTYSGDRLDIGYNAN